MKKLYEIADQYEQVFNEAIDPETGEIDENKMLMLDDIKADANEKGIAVASRIRNLMAEHNAIKEARTSMAAREKTLAREMEFLEGYLQRNMERCRIQKISCPWFVISLRKCNPSVDDDTLDMAQLPEQYIRVKREPNKVDILRDIKAGIHVPGASLKQNNSISIK